MTKEFVGRKMADVENTLAEEELEKKAGKEGFSESPPLYFGWMWCGVWINEDGAGPDGWADGECCA